MYRNFLKRLIDFFIVLSALLIIWPILLIITFSFILQIKVPVSSLPRLVPGKMPRYLRLLNLRP